MGCGRAGCGCASQRAEARDHSDEQQRKELFGTDGTDAETPTQLDESAVKALLAIKSKAKFNEQLEKLVKTDAEKRMLVELAFKAGAEDAESWKVDTLRSLAEKLSKV